MITIPAKNVLFVEPCDARANRIRWQRIPSLPYDATYELQKAETSSGQWTTLATFTSTSAPIHLDTTANNMQLRVGNEYYRLYFPSINTVTEPVYEYGSIDPYGAEMARRHTLYLKDAKGGSKIYVFIKRRQGEHCPTCWDEITMQRTVSNCLDCINSGYRYGYYDPVVSYISFGPDAVSVSVQLDGPQRDSENVNGWMSNYPLLSPGDVLIEADRTMLWEVLSVDSTLHRRAVTRQVLVLGYIGDESPTWELLNRINRS